MVGALLALGGCGGGNRSTRTQSRPNAGSASVKPAAGLTRFSDPGLLSISYPSRWSRLPSGDPQVPLLVSSPDHAEALLLRVTRIGLAVRTVTLRELPKLRPLTDHIIGADPNAHLVQPVREAVLGGLPGFLYVYTATGKLRGPGIGHVHYFFFRGQTLIQLVFQAAQSSRLQAAAHDFERIEATFKATPVPVAAPRKR